MKLKTRLKLSFCILVIIPVLMTGMLLCLLFYRQSVNIRQEYEMAGNMELEDVYAPINLIYQISSGVYERLRADVLENGDRYDDAEYLGGLAASLSKRLVSLAVCSNGKLIYSNAPVANETLQEILPGYGQMHKNSEYGTYYGGSLQCVVKQVDFVNARGNYISVYMITSLRQVLPQIRLLVTESLLAVVLVLFATGGVLTVWIYRAMIRPLSRLTLATNNIKEGNLDFEMNVEGKDEIADVCRNFEEMRLILKKSTAERMKADQEERELIRNISHDLKTPLTAIKGYVEGLLDGVADTPQKREKYLMTIANKVGDMDKLINELTIYARIDTNRVPYVFKKINVTDYFSDCHDEINTELEAKGITLHYENRLGSDAYVMADAEQIKRVINNILSNCVKYMNRDDGRIDIVIEEEGEWVSMLIGDNGRGIHEKDLPHIFERFYRADSSRNSQEGGSGIGLAIVKKIIEDHKGVITAKSREGEGTWLTFRLRKCVQEMPPNGGGDGGGRHE